MIQGLGSFRKERLGGTDRERENRQRGCGEWDTIKKREGEDGGKEDKGQINTLIRMTGRCS